MQLYYNQVAALDVVEGVAEVRIDMSGGDYVLYSTYNTLCTCDLYNYSKCYRRELVPAKSRVNFPSVILR